MIKTAKTNSHRTRIIRNTAYSANFIYLGLHVFYLILFIVSHLWEMVYADISFIGVYFFCFYVLQKAKYYIYALICGNAFLAFISIATIYLGFHSGFHLIIIGLATIAFFTAYFSKVRGVKNPLIWSALSIVVYLTLYFITRFVNPVYTIPFWLETTLMVTNILICFLMLTMYLTIFLKYAFFLEKKIMNESRTDELTQINNRYALYDHLESVDNKTNLFLAIFDIDDFKMVNDTYGHVCGDYILKSIAQITIETMNDEFVCRYGGEEFIVILKNEKKNQVFQRLETLRKNIENYTFEFQDKKIHITITLGAAKYTKNINSLASWIEMADAKLYDGKQTGKNKTVL